MQTSGLPPQPALDQIGGGSDGFSSDMTASTILHTLFIHFAAITQPHHRNHNALIFNFANQTPVANPIAPQLAKLAAFKGISDAARIVQNRHALAQKIPDTLCDRLVEFGKLF